MRKSVLRRPSPALVVSFVALLVALGGTSYAAFSLPKDSVGTKQIKNGAVTNSKLKSGAVTTGKIKNGTVTKSKLNTSGLTVPNATHANSADNATNATNAINAANLGGLPAAGYVNSTQLQRGNVVTLSQGTTGRQLFANGPLSFTADCTLSGGVTTVALHEVSSVANWLSYSTLEAAPGSVSDGTTSDTTTPGSFFGNTNRIDMSAPTGQTIHGQVTYGVNWPSAGQCFVGAYGIG